MTLSSPPNTSEKQQQQSSGSSGNVAENRTSSPNSSPRNSPKPSPCPQTKLDHSGKTDSHLTVNYNKDAFTSNPKQDLSPVQEKASIEVPLVELNRSESTGGSSGKDRKEGRVKKKSSWFNTFYPTYKSRSEDFKRIFKEVSDDERLVVDYACALQKEILVQGRLYVTQNYLCFYANIFGWETNVTLKWKEVSSITKEKTALVIPNAVLINTRSDKYFFTSFVARDKTYLMLFRVWQNALMDQPMTPKEMWQWVRSASQYSMFFVGLHRASELVVRQCYGEELGLTSDDEDYRDYVALEAEEDKLSGKLFLESCSEQECVNSTDAMIDQLVADSKAEDAGPSLIHHFQEVRVKSSDGSVPTDFSDTTESDAERTRFDSTPAVCTNPHEGRQLVNEVFPFHVDHLFTLLFTSSKFFLDFHVSRKNTDLQPSAWTCSETDNVKKRVMTLTMSLNQTLGPKVSHVTETQVMLPCSKPGHLYGIDVESVNAGIPYADSFSVMVHYCLQRVSDKESSLSVYAHISYRKSVWGLVKGMIEKSCWQGLEDHFCALTKALAAEADDVVSPAAKRKTHRQRRAQSLQRNGAEDIRSKLGVLTRNTSAPVGVFSSDIATIVVFSVLILLVILNLLLYYKLWSLEDVTPYTLMDLHILKDPPASHDDWLKLLQHQENVHSIEIQKWQRILRNAIKLLKQTEESLNELQRSINPATSKIMSLLQNGETKNHDDL